MDIVEYLRVKFFQLNIYLLHIGILCTYCHIVELSFIQCVKMYQGLLNTRFHQSIMFFKKNLFSQISILPKFSNTYVHWYMPGALPPCQPSKIFMKTCFCVCVILCLLLAVFQVFSFQQNPNKRKLTLPTTVFNYNGLERVEPQSLSMRSSTETKLLKNNITRWQQHCGDTLAYKCKANVMDL